MKQLSDPELNHKFRLPHIGQRIIKTTVAVFLCLVIYWLRGYQGSEMPTESAITAIICLQPYVRDTRDYAFNRIAGTLVGTFTGAVMLILLYAVPWLGTYKPVLYGLMALGVLASLYGAVLIRMPDTSSLAAIVFLCIVIAFPDIDEPLTQAVNRMLDVFIGTAVAIGVNVFRLPREKHRERVFFLRTADLAPDRFSQIHPAALFRLNYLYNDGAKICLMSEHAPAFFTLQMSAAKLSVPLIVMDGAAIYDANENVFLQTETLPPPDSARLQARLDELGVSYFVYTVHKNKTCIFHYGEIREEEKVIYERMRRSPYRSYLDGEIFSATEIVYFKIIARDEQIQKVRADLADALPKDKVRVVIRRQPAAPGISGLYVYTKGASMKQAENRLMEILRKEDQSLRPVEAKLTEPYTSERDAMYLLHIVGKYYEPVRRPFKRK